MNILLVDDNSGDRALLKYLLKKLPATKTVTEARTIANALRHLKREAPDVVLLDYRLPGVAHLEGLDMVRNIDPLVPIVLVTAFGSQQLGNSAKSAGADEFIQKQWITAEQLQQAIESAIDRARSRIQDASRERDLEQIAHVLSPEKPTDVCGLLEQRAAVSGNDFERNVDRLIDAAGGADLLLKQLAALRQTDTSVSEMQLVDLEQLVRETVAVVRRTENATHATVDIRKLPIISSNRELLRQIIQQLTSNALKYNRNKKPILTVSYQQADGMHLLRFIDNGIGVAEHELENIFKPFVRLHDQSEFAGGGLGLAICRKNAALLEGQLTINSTVGKGSTLTLSLPVTAR